MKTAVITGCDSGIGKSLCRVFADNGYAVIISYLLENPYPGENNILARKMDLREESDIAAFSSFVSGHCSQGSSLDYFINNAGIGTGGPFENLPLELYREVFEVNFFGLLSVTRKVLSDLIRDGGRLVVIGSMAGRIALPFMSPYVSTKFALEGWCDSIRRELNPFGVKTILIEPAGIATPIWNKSIEQDPSFVDEKYRHSLEKFRENFLRKGNEGMDTDAAARQIFRFITRKNPGARYIVARNRLSSFIQLCVPNRLLDRAIAGMFDMRYHE